MLTINFIEIDRVDPICVMLGELLHT